MLTQHKNFVGRLALALTLLLILAACNGGTDEGETEAAPTAVEAVAPAVDDETSPVEAEETPATAEETAGEDTTGEDTEASGAEAITDTETSETTAVTGTAETDDELTTEDVTVITGTELITGTEVTTDVIVSTETVILEQQLVTTVITATDLVTDIQVLTDVETTTESDLITDTGDMTTEVESEAVAAAVEVTELTPTPSPTVVVEVTRVVTDTEVVTETVPATVTATPAPRTPTPTVVVEVTRVVTDTEVVTDTTTVTAVATPAAGGTVTDTAAVTDTATITDFAAQAATFARVEGAEGVLIPASTLLGYDFENLDGEVSGTIQDLMIDAATGQVLFATLEYGGFLDIGDTELSVPLSAFTWGADNTLVLNFAEEQLQEFPDQGEGWPDVSDPSWDDEVLAFWETIEVDPGFEISEASTSIMRASELLDLSVDDIGYGDGDVQDLIIALGEGRAKYMLISFAEGFDEEWVAVPFSAFAAAAAGEPLAFAEGFDPAVLEGAPRTDAAAFDAADPVSVQIDENADNYWADAGYPVTTGESE